MNKTVITSILLILSLFVVGQTVKTDSTVTTYLHIKQYTRDIYQREDPIISFQLTNLDTLGKPNWSSNEIKEFEKNENGYFIKLNVPWNLSKNSSQMWCEAKTLKKGKKGMDTVSTKYGGVKLSNIKLILKSNPKGAETYLIPNRIWQSKLKNLKLEKDDSPIQKYRVNTSSTDTYAYVDETVFVVMFKINNKFKKIIHNTKPYEIQSEQTVWIDF